MAVSKDDAAVAAGGLVAGALVAALVYGIGSTAAATMDNYSRAAGTGAYEEAYVPGQPLDMVRMSAPSWSSCDHMYRIVDRTSGACWVRIRMDGAWETWLVCEGQSYIAQQVGQPAPAGEGAE